MHRIVVIFFLMLAGPLKAEPLSVFKSPTCGCCNAWIDHLENHGFEVEKIDQVDMAAVKHEHGIHPQLQSCHTAVTEEGYVFEGHVPAAAVSKFLANPPVGATGLAVPGMPVGSPGMEMGERFSPYVIVQMNGDEAPGIYQRVNSKADQE